MQGSRSIHVQKLVARQQHLGVALPARQLIPARLLTASSLPPKREVAACPAPLRPPSARHGHRSADKRGSRGRCRRSLGLRPGRGATRRLGLTDDRTDCSARTVAAAAPSFPCGWSLVMLRVGEVEQLRSRPFQVVPAHPGVDGAPADYRAELRSVDWPPMVRSSWPAGTASSASRQLSTSSRRRTHVARHSADASCRRRPSAECGVRNTEWQRVAGFGLWL